MNCFSPSTSRPLSFTSRPTASKLEEPLSVDASGECLCPPSERNKTRALGQCCSDATGRPSVLRRAAVIP